MTTTLHERIEIALAKSGLSKQDLAAAIKVSRQAIHGLSRRPGSTMKPEHIAHAAKALHCDLYWLCTGEGGRYVPAQKSAGYTYFATEAARMLDDLPPVDRERAFLVVYQLCHGRWPVSFNANASPEAPPAEVGPNSLS